MGFSGRLLIAVCSVEPESTKGIEVGAGLSGNRLGLPMRTVQAVRASDVIRAMMPFIRKVLYQSEWWYWKNLSHLCR